MQQCLNCGRELAADAIARGYCPSCGAPVATAPAATPPAAQTPPPYPQYTPPAGGGYGQPAYSQPLAYQGPDQPQQPPAPEQPQAPQPPPPYQGQQATPEQPQQPAYAPQPPYPPTGAPPVYPPASTPYPGQAYPGQQFPPSASYQGQPGGDAAPGYPPPAYPQPSTPYQPGITGVFPQQPGTGAYPQQPGSGVYMPPQGTGAYPPGMYPGYAPTLPPPPKPNNNSVIIGLVAAFVVVVLLAGTLFILGKSGSGPLASAFATATPVATSTPVPTNTPVPTATPAVPAGFTAFTSPDGSYTVDYPAGFQPKDASNSGVTVETFNSVLDQVLILPNVPTTPPDQYSSILQTLLSVNFTQVVIASSTQSATIGANTWTTLGATAKQGGIPFTVDLYGIDHGGASTFIITLAPTSNASSNNKTYFQPMIQSFTFLK